MAFLQQPSPGHSWTSPNHFLSCDTCHNHRKGVSTQQLVVAHRLACTVAHSVGQPYTYRAIAVSPRLSRFDLDPRLRHLGRAQAEERNARAPPPSQRPPVTIQVPNLYRPVRTNSAIALPLRRGRDFDDTPEPARYFVPERTPTKAGLDLAANSEAEGTTPSGPSPSHSPTSSPTSSLIDDFDLPMPGTWPSWADEPNPVPPPSRPAVSRAELQPPSSDPLDAAATPHGNGVFTIFRGVSAFVFGAFRSVSWRVTQPAEQPQSVVDPIVDPTLAWTTAMTQTGLVTQNDVPRVPKRPRISSGPERLGSLSSNGSLPFYARSISTPNANFNHAGHFSLDAIDSSDSEDEENGQENVGSPMDIDTPSPVGLNPSNPVWAGESTHMNSPFWPRPQRRLIDPENFRSVLRSENRLNTSPANVAVRRAVKFFPKGSPSPKQPVSPSKANSDVRDESRLENTATTTYDAPSPGKTNTARYGDALEFFPNEVIHSLPGLGDESLPADGLKVELLKRQMMERLRKEEEETQNAIFRHLGVRRPKAPLITEAPSQWMRRVLDAPRSGTFDPRPVHPDAVELKPRDFAKLIPATGWLNDDCVHSTLCCLAAYINNKAGVKPKVDTPKCVAVSSLYWKAFCDDYNKLFPRPFSRKWHMLPGNFLDIDTVLIPVNSNAHWTLIVIRPSRRTVSYLDSFHHRSQAQLNHAYHWIKRFLGDKFVREEWNTIDFTIPRQTNAFDCGVFVLTNAICLALGVSPHTYDESELPKQRRWLGGMLLNGGFKGMFSLDRF
ncbi:hypothetical protein F4808DRAFT_458690 [Astrocystis sublimbata]|nr:hypothetical protein F4808DRAFT_458690 [Astrocystis sublimbata]